MPRPTPEDLEKLIHRTLRALPDRPAPSSLETNVLAMIAARQALPWWRQSFTHWPLAARGAFLVLTALLAAALIALGFRSGAGEGVSSALAAPSVWLAHCKTVYGALSGLGALLMRSIPAYWIYGGTAFIATMYAALIGLGATAYRAFIFQR